MMVRINNNLSINFYEKNNRKAESEEKSPENTASSIDPHKTQNQVSQQGGTPSAAPPSEATNRTEVRDLSESGPIGREQLKGNSLDNWDTGEHRQSTSDYLDLKYNKITDDMYTETPSKESRTSAKIKYEKQQLTGEDKPKVKHINKKT